MTSPERRQSPRLPVELYVEFRHLGRPSTSYAELSRNLSAGGVFVDTSVGLPVGTAVALAISPGPGAPAIQVRATVVRVEEDPVATGSRATRRMRGMALEFVDPDSEELKRLLSLAEKMAAEGLDAGNPTIRS